MLMSKCKALKFPTLLVNNLFFLNCKEYAKRFTKFSRLLLVIGCDDTVQ